MYENAKHVEDTFTEENLSVHLREAQRAEFAELEKVILERVEHGKPLKILDVGIGNARVLSLLAQKPELWGAVECFEGIDVAQNCVDLSQKAINKLGIGDKANVRLLDALNLEELNNSYDLIIATWFTAGNFYPSEFNPKNFKPGESDLSTNAKFTDVFRQAYEKLNPGGEIVIGSIYIDNESTRKKQEDSYRAFGWRVITDERDSFTASEEGWWSQRFTKDRVREYLPFVPKEKISFTPLDTYQYAMMVRIQK